VSDAIRVAELFAGVGGFRLGLDGFESKNEPQFNMPSAGDFTTVWANQWEPPGSECKQFAWRCYESHFGKNSCVNEDIHAVLDRAEAGLYEIPDVDMVVGGFPCFVAGTPVLTSEGYKPIEDIRPGDMVLTHRNRFRKVVKTGVKHDAPLVEVKIMGSLPITCTPNHPFMTRSRDRVWYNNRWDYAFGDLHETPAKNLDSRTFVMVPEIETRVANPYAMTEEEAWLIGRYVADGYYSDSLRTGRKNSYKHRITFCIGHGKLDAFIGHLDKYHATICKEERSVNKVIVTSERLLELIKIYAPGKGALNKNFAIDVMSLPVELKTSILDGYESGDACRYISNGDETDISISTVSIGLARMLCLLIHDVRNRVATVSCSRMPETTVIEGRIVNQHDFYTVRYKRGEYKRRQTFEVDGNIYTPVRSVSTLDVRGTVYNFEVEEDHTYVVENAVVHNCQDYSIAKPLSMAGGIEGKKGVLWWEIYRFLQFKPQVRFCLFENVDRLLKSPASQRGRDFAIILSCLMNLGFSVEWRVVNSAEYGFPQRRKRVFIYAERDTTWDLRSRLLDGVMSDALPCEIKGDVAEFGILDDPYAITTSWPQYKVSPFLEAGVASRFGVATCHIEETYDGPRRVLGDVVVPAGDVPDAFWVADDQLSKWQYLKGSKREERTTKDGYTYWYSEGSMAYPDLLTNPSRTILTGEGGRGASRFKHIINQGGCMRRLVPDELDMLQTFPKGWTNTGMTDGQRAFCMGNALVVGVVHRIGVAIAGRIGN
jgi:DNA (cytosine-5)-methyltransferase 1